MSRAKQSMDGNTAAAHVAYAFTDTIQPDGRYRRSVVCSRTGEHFWQSGKSRRDGV